MCFMVYKNFMLWLNFMCKMFLDLNYLQIFIKKTVLVKLPYLFFVPGVEVHVLWSGPVVKGGESLELPLLEGDEDDSIWSPIRLTRQGFNLGELLYLKEKFKN